jgi:CubicO group peptidase (beta-lactamase class C family)
VLDQDPPTAIGIGGVGGSFAGADRATGITFAVTKNRLMNDFQTATEIIGLVYRLSQED